MAQYEKSNRAYLDTPKEVEDNLLKQAKTVCRPSPEDFQHYFGEFYNAEQDEAYDEINERISEYEARQYLEMWQKILSGFAREKDRLSKLR